ncbi:helix-turn-helix domain-containing protein [Micromonospora sp. NPDC047670]|uniref:helix-turn-helix domain-containing protein n=1 Tax=Micromonospora sp. NPDC047670 TaxID=3364252 RepID=UPI003713BBED
MQAGCLRPPLLAEPERLISAIAKLVGVSRSTIYNVLPAAAAVGSAAPRRTDRHPARWKRCRSSGDVDSAPAIAVTGLATSPTAGPPDRYGNEDRPRGHPRKSDTDSTASNLRAARSSREHM